MNIQIDTRDVGVSLDLLAEEVGETTEQATVRLAVGVARGLAEETKPKGRSTVAKRKKRAAAGMRRVVEPVAPRYFTALKRGKYERIKIGGQWVPVRPDRLLDTVQDVWDAVERHRDAEGKVKKLGPEARYFCRRAVFNKVATKRARLWGVAKGSWIGAGQMIARKQQGLDRVNIGKNFLAWTQRHAKKGQATQVGRRDDTTVILASRAKSLAGDGALSTGAIHRALHRARKAMWKYYEFRLRSIRRAKQ